MTDLHPFIGSLESQTTVVDRSVHTEKYQAGVRLTDEQLLAADCPDEEWTLETLGGSKACW